MSCKSEKLVKYGYIGRKNYSEALSLQRCLHDWLVESDTVQSGYLLLLEHNPVITNGRFGNINNLKLSMREIEKKGVRVYGTSRGGDLTYHGPGQLIAYPIISLRKLGLGVKSYVSSLEEVVIKVLNEYGIDGKRREGFPGVWTRGAKIASVGISIERGVTMHGAALNVNTDLSYFSLMAPCGISDVSVTSMEAILGSPQDMEIIAQSFAKCFRRELGVKLDPSFDSQEPFTTLPIVPYSKPL